MFLGQRIVRRAYGTKRYVYTFVSNEALASIKRKVKALTGRSTTNLALSELIAALNPVLRGWVNYYRHAAAKRTFGYLGYYVWWRVGRWLRKKHPRMSWKQIKRRYLNDDYTFQARGSRSTNRPARASRVTGYRGARIPTPWTRQPTQPARAPKPQASKNSCRSNASNRRSHEPDPTPCAHGEPDAATSRTSGSAGGGEETTGRKTASAPRRRRAPRRRQPGLRCRSASLWFGMNPGTTPARTVRPGAACRSSDSRRSASGPALSLS